MFCCRGVVLFFIYRRGRFGDVRREGVRRVVGSVL